MDLNIPLDILGYKFCQKPLLIGGMAMEYYGLRKAGADIDFVVSIGDHQQLVKLYPDHIKDLYGDIGVCEYKFEIWNQICRFDYNTLKEGAIEEENFLVISLEKLLFLKALAIKHDKYYKDVLLLVDEILKQQYADK